VRGSLELTVGVRAMHSRSFFLSFYARRLPLIGSFGHFGGSFEVDWVRGRRDCSVGDRWRMLSTVCPLLLMVVAVSQRGTSVLGGLITDSSADCARQFPTPAIV
jgi:hypothetical protein